eukprot:2172400-Prymnesium_polylepis.1
MAARIEPVEVPGVGRPIAQLASRPVVPFSAISVSTFAGLETTAAGAPSFAHLAWPRLQLRTADPHDVVAQPALARWRVAARSIVAFAAVATLRGAVHRVATQRTQHTVVFATFRLIVTGAARVTLRLAFLRLVVPWRAPIGALSTRQSGCRSVASRWARLRSGGAEQAHVAERTDGAFCRLTQIRFVRKTPRWTRHCYRCTFRTL